MRSARREKRPRWARARARALRSLAMIVVDCSQPRSTSTMASESGSSPVAQAADHTTGRRPAAIAGPMIRSTSSWIGGNSRKK